MSNFEKIFSCVVLFAFFNYLNGFPVGGYTAYDLRPCIKYFLNSQNNSEFSINLQELDLKNLKALLLDPQNSKYKNEIEEIYLRKCNVISWIKYKLFGADYRSSGKSLGRIVEPSIKVDYTENTDNDCIICLESIEKFPKKLSCGHNQFHSKCFATWLEEQATCPLCRHEL